MSGHVDRVTQRLNAERLRADLAEARIVALVREVDVARAELEANRWRSYCTYCGHVSTATSEQERTEQMGAHIDACERHPLRILGVIAGYLDLPTEALLPENISSLPEKLEERVASVALAVIAEARKVDEDESQRCEACAAVIPEGSDYATDDDGHCFCAACTEAAAEEASEAAAEATNAEQPEPAA
jgi:hypothetical protein